MKMREEKLENCRELLDDKRKDLAGRCSKQDLEPHSYSDFEFHRKESLWTKITGFLIRRVVKRYKCRKCYNTIKKGKLQQLKEIRDFEWFIRRNTR